MKSQTSWPISIPKMPAHSFRTNRRLRLARKIFADAWKAASCARFSGFGRLDGSKVENGRSEIRTFGRVETEEIAAKGCFNRDRRRPTILEIDAAVAFPSGSPGG